MPCMIAVHCGAGTHGSSQHKNYNSLSRKACRKGIELLKTGACALEAIKATIAVLEDDPLTNCGYGSNLTMEGSVECDASVMDGKTLNFGACGAVKNVKNPVELAYDICVKQAETLPFGLIAPSTMTGRGAYLHAKKAGLRTVKTKALISQKAMKQYKKYKSMIEKDNEALLDTVGAVCVDLRGHVAAGCSSGGILLKKSGRVGQAGIYSSGVWADSSDEYSDVAVAVCTSGCGEHLIKTQLAKELAEDVKKGSCSVTSVSTSINDKFLNSRFLKDVPLKLCGALVLHVDQKTGDSMVLWAHTTETMSIGFMRDCDDRATAFISELPADIPVGVKVNVSGVFNCNKKE